MGKALGRRYLNDYTLNHFLLFNLPLFMLTTICTVFGFYKLLITPIVCYSIWFIDLC